MRNRNSLARGLMMAAALGAIAERATDIKTSTISSTPKKSSKGTKSEKKAAKKNRQRIILAEKEENDRTDEGTS